MRERLCTLDRRCRDWAIAVLVCVALGLSACSATPRPVRSVHRRALLSQLRCGLADVTPTPASWRRIPALSTLSEYYPPPAAVWMGTRCSSSSRGNPKTYCRRR